MASSWTHAVGAIAIAAVAIPNTTQRRIWPLLAVAAVLPDVDAIGRPFGAGDLMWLGGHRALTHSVSAAIVVGLVLTLFVSRSDAPVRERCVLWSGLSLAIASHGVLDSLTTYGEGVQFWAPWSTGRYRAPWRILGGGIVRDTIAFCGFYVFTRWAMLRRGLAVPRFFDPQFMRGSV